MVSENEVMNLRMRFSKTGNLAYISHLDLQRTMQRIIIRSGIDIWYTEGFNPQAHIVFASPLPLGTESVCELMDFRLNHRADCEEIKKQLSSCMPRELQISEIYEPSEKFKGIEYMSYRIELFLHEPTQALCDQMQTVFENDIIIVKKGKSGEREVNISPLVKKFNVSLQENKIVIDCILNAKDDQYLNPEHMISAICKKLNIMQNDSIDEYHTVLRTNMLKADFSEFR